MTSNKKNNFIERIKKMTDDELDEELLSQEINDIGRHIVLQEKTKRQFKKPHWTVIPTFIIVLLTLIIMVLLNYDKIILILSKIVYYLIKQFGIS
ncbi:hypothetical protein KAS42_01105 [bacterium]|nr:hypothetical protein [bacterium]